MHPYPKRARRGRQSGSSAPRAISSLEVALDYLGWGFCPIPQRPGAKMPCIKWKPFQEVQPEVADLEGWFGGRFTGAGIALVLGPPFGLMVVDVDGEEAFRTLVGRLGGEPEAPTVMSGSDDPYRRHYYFRHPPVTTKARYCPWHRGLEFRSSAWSSSTAPAGTTGSSGRGPTWPVAGSASRRLSQRSSPVTQSAPSVASTWIDQRV